MTIFVHPPVWFVHLSVSPLYTFTFTSTLSSSSDPNSDVQPQPPGWSPRHTLFDTNTNVTFLRYLISDSYTRVLQWAS